VQTDHNHSIPERHTEGPAQWAASALLAFVIPFFSRRIEHGPGGTPIPPVGKVRASGTISTDTDDIGSRRRRSKALTPLTLQV
jgi:hypothetical protein